MQRTPEHMYPQRRRVVYMLRRFYRDLDHLSDQDLILHIDPAEFFATKGVTSEMDRMFRKVQKSTREDRLKGFQRNQPEFIAVCRFFYSLNPWLNGCSFYYLRFLFELDQIRPLATKNIKGLTDLLAFPNDDGPQDQDYDLLKSSQRFGFPSYMSLTESEFNILKVVLDQPEYSQLSALELVGKIDVKAFCQNSKIGARKRAALEGVIRKIYRPSREHYHQIADFFGFRVQDFKPRFATGVIDFNQVEIEIFQCFRLLPFSKRVIYGQVSGINMKKLNQKLIAKVIQVTESRISQKIKLISTIIRNWLSHDQRQFLFQNYRSVECLDRFPNLVKIFDTKKSFFKFLGDLVDAPSKTEMESTPIHRNVLYDALAHWGPIITLDELERHLIENQGLTLDDLYHTLLTTDLIDDRNLVFEKGTFTVRHMIHRYLIGALACKFVDGIDAAGLMKEIEKSGITHDYHHRSLSDTFRKSQFMYTIDKSFYRHIRYYDPNEQILQVVIRQMFQIIREPRPESIKSIYDLYDAVPKARYISQYFFCFVFRNSCETVDFDIHPSYFELVQKQGPFVEDEVILNHFRKNRRASQRSEFTELLGSDLRYVTMRLSQLVRAKKIIRVNREAYELSSRAMNGVSAKELISFMISFVRDADRMVDFSYLTKEVNREFNIQRKKEFFHSIFVQELDQSGLFLNRYLVSKGPIPFISLRDLVNRTFDSKLTDAALLEKIHDSALVAKEMDQTIQNVWIFYLRVQEQRRQSLKAG